MIDVISLVKEYWTSKGAQCRQGADPAVIDEFMRSNQVVLPDDACRYFTGINGIEGFDDNMMAFWPIDKIVRLPILDDLADLQLDDAESYFVFGDFMIETNYYAIRLTGGSDTGNAVISTAAPWPHTVAHSLSEFLWLYMTDINKTM